MAQTNEISANFLPTTQVWDIQDLRKMNVDSPQFKEMVIGLYQRLNGHADALNNKTIGLYDTQEYVCGKTYFSAPTVGGASTKATTPYLRPVYRKVIDFGALPNTATKTVLHGITITASLFFTFIGGATKDPLNNRYLPLPFATPGALAGAIELWIDGANVTIITGGDRSMYTQTYITLEYLKE